MPPVKFKPPTQTKAQLMKLVSLKVQERYPTQPDRALEYVLNFFTSVDLVGILEDLKR